MQIFMPININVENINEWCKNKALECKWSNVYPSKGCFLRVLGDDILCPFNKECDKITLDDWKNILKIY